jgi:energy-coupling factor transport system ATP-binding protein
MTPIIETQELTHIYSRGTPFEHHGSALGRDFHADEGEFVGLIGHTGSGKSTLIQHLNGLLKPTEGKVLFRGQNIWSDPKTTRATRFKVGMVFHTGISVV